MNWRKIVKYAAALLFAQFFIGFLSGLLEPNWSDEHLRFGSIAWLVGNSFVSFVACSSVFAHMATRQRYRPFSHAWLVLLLESAAWFPVGLAIEHWLGSVPLPFVILEWLIVLSALAVGTMLGRAIREGRDVPCIG